MMIQVQVAAGGDSVPWLVIDGATALEGLDGMSVEVAEGMIDPAAYEAVLGAVEGETFDVTHAGENELSVPGAADGSGELVVTDGASAPAEPADAETEEMSMKTDEDERRYETSDDGAWEGVLIVEGMVSGDGRLIGENALTWRELPLPLMMMQRNPEGGEGHAGASLAGRIEWLERRGNEVWGGGHLDLGSESGREALRLMQEGMLRGVSADLDSVDVMFDASDPLAGLDPKQMMEIAEGRIMGATLTPFPAFQEAQVRLVGAGEALATEEEEQLEAVAASAGASAFVWTPWEASLVASATAPPVAPPAAWFEAPPLEALRQMRQEGRQTVLEADGRIYGFACRFGDGHIGFPGRKVTAPRSKAQYAYFMTGEVECADGTVVATGPLVTDTVHPKLALQASDASAFYADTGCAAADVAMHEVRLDGRDVLVYAGAQRPTITPLQKRVLRASDGVSPDWRRIGGNLEMVALLSVNNSGLKVPAMPDALAASAGPAPGQMHALHRGGEVVAMVGGDPVTPTMEELAEQMAALRADFAELEGSLRTDRASRTLERLAAVPSVQELTAARVARRAAVVARFSKAG